MVTPAGGRHAARPGPGAVRADRLRRLPEGRGRQPHRLLQGPRHDDGHHPGQGGGRPGRHLRLHRQHLRLGRGLRGAGRDGLRGAGAAGQDRAGQDGPGAGARRAASSRWTATSTTASTLARGLSEKYPVALVNSVNPVAHRGAEDGRVRDRRRARRRARHPRPAGRQRGQHHRLLEGLPRVRGRRRRRPARPRMWGFQASGVRADRATASRCKDPQTIATAIRIGNPASWQRGRAGAGRVRRAHRRGDRPSDPVRLPAAGRAGGRLRGARLGGVASRGCSRPRRRAGSTRASASSARSPATASRTPTGRSPARRSPSRSRSTPTPPPSGSAWPERTSGPASHRAGSRHDADPGDARGGATTRIVRRACALCRRRTFLR